MITETPERTFHVSCDIDGAILDPGAADAPMGGYRTREEAGTAAEAHGWAAGHWSDVHLCPVCVAAVVELLDGKGAAA
jgi:hypothetical protein